MVSIHQAISDLQKCELLKEDRFTENMIEREEKDPSAMTTPGELIILLQALEHYNTMIKEKRLYELPIGLGAPVYVVEKCQCGIHYDCRLSKRATAKRKAIVIKEVGVNKHNQRNCIKIFERPFAIKMLPHIGKTVFLSLEEAKEKINI